MSLKVVFQNKFDIYLYMSNDLKTGVYQIKNKINKKFYIGSTSGKFVTRYHSHRTKLRYNRHENTHLQNAWNKHGEKNFEFVVLEQCDIDKRFEREQYYIDKLNPEYNILKFAGGGIKGYRHKSKTKKLISQLQLGEKHWSYKGKFVFYHQEENYFVGDMKSFSLEKNIIYSACSKLVNNTISSYKKWICLGQYNDNFKLPVNDINNIYRKILNRGCDYYAFYNKNDEHFIGTFGEFLKKYNLKRNNIKGIINGKRLSASGWICMGKCDEKYIFPKNIKEIYDIRISKNKKLKNH